MHASPGLTSSNGSPGTQTDTLGATHLKAPPSHAQSPPRSRFASPEKGERWPSLRDTPVPPAPPSSPEPRSNDRRPPSPAPTLCSDFSERSTHAIDPEEEIEFFKDLLGDISDLPRPPAYTPSIFQYHKGSGDPLSKGAGNEDDDDEDDDDESDSDEDDSDDEDDEDDEDDDPDPDPPHEPIPQNGPGVAPGAPATPPGDVGGPGDPDDNELCAAFFEHPTLRNIYIRTYIRAACAGATTKDTYATLESHRLALEALAAVGQLPNDLLDDVAKMPRTLRTLQRRLGVDTDSLLRTYALCTQCGKRYGMDYVNDAQQPNCPRHVAGAICGNQLYRISTLYDGTRRRIPIKSFTYLPIQVALERMLIRAGMPHTMQHWRTNNDNPGDAEPSNRRAWKENTAEDQLFGDISTAYGWRSQRCGMTRSYNVEDQQYADEEPEGGPRSLAQKHFGLSLGINFDGFQAFKNKKHEVQGVFIIVNNLPFFLRTSIENMVLAIVMPGPSQPSSYELDQMLEPLVDDLIELEKGVEMKVYDSELGQPVVQQVYARLSVAIVDYIARIKLAGHAGTASHRHFCLYCDTLRWYLSVPDGFQNLDLRNPMEYLQHKHMWLRAAPEDREDIQKENGTKFTEIDRLPGWYAPSCSPIDAMHLFDLGITRYICKDILLKHSLLHPRRRGQPHDERPLQRFIAFMGRCYFPSHCSRLPPQFDEISGKVKAEQWRNQSVVLHVALFEAFREGDEVPDGELPRGGRATKIFAQQAATARKVHRNRCAVHTDQGRDEADRPQEEDCWPSRTPRNHLKTIFCYLVALRILFTHQLTRHDLAFAQQLLWRTATNFARMNISLTPSFHFMMHIEEQVLRFGSLYGTWTNAFERANRVLINVNTNGRGFGMLETTMARGFLKRVDCFWLVEHMQAIPNPSHDDIVTTDIILKLLREAPEHQLQQRLHGRVLENEARFRVQERTRLPGNPAKVNFRDQVHQPYYELVLHFLGQQIPDFVVYGEGARPQNGVRVAPTGSTLAFAHVTQLGLRYGADGHYRGHSARYGYIRGRNPALIKKVYQSTLRLPNGEEQKMIVIIVQRFKRPDQEPRFPWHHWRDRLGTHTWEYEQLEEPQAIGPDELTGVFALSDIEMSYGRYWITFSMDHTKPEDLQEPIDE